MKIALVQYPLGHRRFSENLKVIDEEFCLAPPIVLAYVAAILENAGHKVIIIDAHARRLTKEKVLRLLMDFSPDIIGFRADTYWFHAAAEWACFFRSRLNAKIIVGGINMSLYPLESMAAGCFDYGLIGEANHSLPGLISEIEKGCLPEKIPGAVYKKNGVFVFNEPSSRPVDFDSYPLPARHLLPNHLYHSFTSQLRNFTIMLTSLGCPFHCSFCAISRLGYRERSVAGVIDEIEQCYKKYNVREIDFFDATFFANKQRSLSICEQILKKGLKLEWSCRSRVDVVDDEILKTAYRAGCRKIYYGIESASDEVLKNVNKQISVAQIRHAISLTHKNGINALGFFMIGNPSDSRGSVMSSMKFAKDLELDFIQVCRAIAKPNTGLNDALMSACGRDFWREYVLGKRKDMRLPMPWTDLTHEEIEALAKKFYQDFYLRPGYILKRIRKTRSLGEFLRYAKAGTKWFFCNRSDVNK